MQIITNPLEIDKTLTNLINHYKKYYIATAWASLGSKASSALLGKKENIKKMVVGTHFYQTHPDFINEFISNRKVRFILKPDGVYHPKIYLFENSKQEWECLIGSANFTKFALSKNDEIIARINHNDSDSKEAYESIHEAITGYWENAEAISEEQYHRYKNIWKKNQKTLASLQETYGSARNSKPLVKSEVFSLTWPEYFNKIINDEFHSFHGRISLLSTVREYFLEYQSFSMMPQINRREIAGVATSKQSDAGIDWGWFGSMSGAGKFQNRINENNNLLSLALDHIPLQDNIQKSDYDNFVELFKQAFPGGGAGVAIASRLLAMKRPDYFVCLDSRNRSKLCEDFGIPEKTSFETYWSEIIERILNSAWWSSDRPENDIELQAWRGRSAMLDVLFYEEP